MGLGTCTVCKKPMASDALACPHCGTQQRPQKKGIGFLGSVGILFGIVVIIGALSSTGNHSTHASAASSTPTTSRAPDDAELRVNARTVVREQLRDPESARFTEEFVHHTKDSLTAVCGSVNAKNGFGGYGGDKAFFVIGSVAMIQPNSDDSGFDKFYKLWNAACSDGKP